ncbi:hypothetical protein JX266_014417 [Neoarthrinium moseri]|nr:hypothetical protein JX266_014417 [Neoarthrinium moseri]
MPRNEEYDGVVDKNEELADALVSLLDGIAEEIHLGLLADANSMELKKAQHEKKLLALSSRVNAERLKRPKLTVLPSANQDDCQRTVIEGLGGTGKTQIALEAAFRIRQAHPKCSVIWVPAVTAATFDNAYRAIGQRLGTAGLDDDKADVKPLVKTALERTLDDWLLIVDNADNADLIFSDDGMSLHKCLPFSRRGSILMTTQVHEVAVRLDVPMRNAFALAEMSETEATQMLRTSLSEKQMRDGASTRGLLDYLARLPLAVKRTSAYMAQTGISTAKYLGYCRSLDTD